MLKHLKLKWKIYSFPAAAGIMLAAVLVIGQMYAGKNNALIENTVTRHIPAWEISRDLHQYLVESRQALANAVRETSMDKIRLADAVQVNFVSHIEMAADNGILDRKEAASILSRFEDYFAAARKLSVQRINNSAPAGAGRRVNEQEAAFRELEEQIRTRIRAEKATLESQMERAAINSRNMRAALSVSIVFFIIVFVTLSILIYNSLSRQVNLLVRAASKVTKGDLTVTVPEYRVDDEIGALMESFGKMVQVLQGLTREIKESANSLASASGQISTSVTQISTAASETASAASETSTTVEEVRMTALDSNRKAKSVSASAMQSVEISAAGERTVQDTIAGMHRIEKQMESIAESIMKLSEHGQAIGDIIAVVEDVAEQSRLLAVNASIEAVKAGEQGKGFSVVAAEVQSLAEQSKAATEHVRTILDDIQKATGEAVMKTEQGTRAVESGVEQSLNSGDAIRKLAESVDAAAQATTQISVSSQEQLVGMEQVVSAMESIKNASSQNVSATRQVESAARDLYQLGRRLSQFMEQYTLN